MAERTVATVVGGGIPPECTGGRAGTIVASLWANCSVTDIYTTDNCRIPGIPDGWY